MIRTGFLEGLSDNIVIDKDKCTFCGICVETCILDNLRMKQAPCQNGCPLGVNCQGYIQLIARGEEVKAMEHLREALPFPEILGRVCSQLCEEACYRKTTDGEAVAIRALKRYLCDQLDKTEVPVPELASGTQKRVAVIGSGPAGLMAAHDLLTRGHEVSIFDSEEAPGGMLRWAIPEFRLPRPVLEKEIELLRKMGGVFHCGVTIGKDETLQDLKNRFDAIIIATGCPRHESLDMDEEDLSGLYHGLPFLRDVRAGKPPKVGKKATVIGGGNTAVDAAQTVLRLGAEDVTIISLESKEEMPAFPWALEEALTEGIRLRNGWGPVRFLPKEGVLNAIDFRRCIRVFDDAGRFNPHFDDTQKISLEADTVIVAIGQTLDTNFLEKIGLPAERIDQVDPLTLQGPDEMVFLAGDVVDGPSSVVEAMAKGRRAAESVDRFLTGEHLRYGREYAGPVETDFEIDTRKGISGKRAKIPVRGLRGKEDFQELERGLDKDTARKEAQRCYSCGEPFGKYRTCWFCLPCEVECPHEALWVEVPYLLR